MHIHQGHWSLSSSAWWTSLCNNQLIYILPSSAICVDYREKAMCVCTCACVCVRHGGVCCIDLTHYVIEFIPLHLICTLIPRKISCMPTLAHTYFAGDCALPPFLPFFPLPIPFPNPFPLVGSSWHWSWVVNSCGLPDCAVLKTWGPLRSLPISAGQSLKAPRCDGADWQLGSNARGYQHSVSREPSHALA